MKITHIPPGLPSIKSCIKNWMSDIVNIQKRAAYDICENLHQVSCQLDYARELLKCNVAYGKWCSEELGWSQSHTHRIREAGRTAGAIMNAPGVSREKNNLPTSVGQLRVMADFSSDEKELQDAWSKISPELPLNKKGEIKSAGVIKDALIEHEYIDAPVKKETPQAKAKCHAKVVPADFLAGLTKEDIKKAGLSDEMILKLANMFYEMLE